jgi:hypothetical protein
MRFLLSLLFCLGLFAQNPTAIGVAQGTTPEAANLAQIDAVKMILIQYRASVSSFSRDVVKTGSADQFSAGSVVYVAFSDIAGLRINKTWVQSGHSYCEASLDIPTLYRTTEQQEALQRHIIDGLLASPLDSDKIVYLKTAWSNYLDMKHQSEVFGFNIPFRDYNLYPRLEDFRLTYKFSKDCANIAPKNPQWWAGSAVIDPQTIIRIIAATDNSRSTRVMELEIMGMHVAKSMMLSPYVNADEIALDVLLNGKPHTIRERFLAGDGFPSESDMISVMSRALREELDKLK